MDLRAFVQCLTEKEQRELFLIFKEKYLPDHLKTVREFFEQHVSRGALGQRLKAYYGHALEDHKTHPEQSCLDRPVKEVGYDNLSTWKGMGRATWLDFAALRDYGS
ncbi:MAG: hypothetical protein EOO14_00690 [Chitinophagaceae bacterium]|nr:MAG: hypothetical protein EOO14_00690 [Chitinophagaceae bacterium]